MRELEGGLGSTVADADRARGSSKARPRHLRPLRAIFLTAWSLERSSSLLKVCPLTIPSLSLSRTEQARSSVLLWCTDCGCRCAEPRV
jgi:hypothetical protein